MGKRRTFSTTVSDSGISEQQVGSVTTEGSLILVVNIDSAQDIVVLTIAIKDTLIQIFRSVITMVDYKSAGVLKDRYYMIFA